MNEDVVARGKIFELVQSTQPDGRVFESARRAPGVRVIIHDSQAGKILFIKEFRQELGDWDYRLPGGKVFDTLEEFAAFRETGQDITEAATNKAVEEVRQEAAIDIDTPELYKVSVLGTTVKWDLYVFVADSWKPSETGQILETGESIEADTWVTYEEAKSMILRGDMQEDRIALILLRWLWSKRAE